MAHIIWTILYGACLYLSNSYFRWWVLVYSSVGIFEWFLIRRLIIDMGWKLSSSMAGLFGKTCSRLRVRIFSLVRIFWAIAEWPIIHWLSHSISASRKPGHVNRLFIVMTISSRSNDNAFCVLLLYCKSIFRLQHCWQFLVLLVLLASCWC